ncbi:hypothetical protein ACNRWW_19325 [Metabacillus sp. HB246100]
MIDWYLMLFIGLTVLISNMKYFGEHKTKADYLFHKQEFGLSEGTFRILFGTLSGTTVLLPIYLMQKIGYLGGFVLAMVGLFTLYGYSLFAPRIKTRLLNLLRHPSQIKPMTKKMMMYVLVLINVEGFLIQALLAEEVLTTVLHVPTSLPLLVICFSCFIFAGMGGSIGVQKVGSFLLICLFLGMTIIPISLYLTQGINPTFQAITSRFPLFLETDHNQLFLYSLLVFIIMSGYLVTNISVNTSLMKIKEKRLKLSLTISAFCWMSVSIAFTAIYIYFIGQSGAISTFYTSLVEQLSPILLYLFVISSLSMFIMSAASSLFSVASLMVLIQKKSNFQKLYIRLCGLSFLPLLLHVYVEDLVQFAIIFYGNLFAACLPIFYYFLKKERELEVTMFIPICLVSLGVFGTLFSLYTSFIQGVLLSFIFAWICLLINKIFFVIYFSEK